MLDLQHVPNIKDGKRLINGFIAGKGVVIAVPSHEHKKIKYLDYSAIRDARTLLARELKNMRQCIGIPAAVVLNVIEANKRMHPGSFKK